MKYENFQKINDIVYSIRNLEEHLTTYQELGCNESIAHGSPTRIRLIEYITDEERLELNKRVKKDLNKKIETLKSELEKL